jgi:hypothetical protein
MKIYCVVFLSQKHFKAPKDKFGKLFRKKGKTAEELEQTNHEKFKKHRSFGFVSPLHDDSCYRLIVTIDLFDSVM